MLRTAHRTPHIQGTEYLVPVPVRLKGSTGMTKIFPSDREKHERKRIKSDY
jgi:hypothetical protein